MRLIAFASDVEDADAGFGAGEEEVGFLGIEEQGVGRKVAFGLGVEDGERKGLGVGV